MNIIKKVTYLNDLLIEKLAKTNKLTAFFEAIEFKYKISREYVVYGKQ
jgi:hypothetical protein